MSMEVTTVGGDGYDLERFARAQLRWDNTKPIGEPECLKVIQRKLIDKDQRAYGDEGDVDHRPAAAGYAGIGDGKHGIIRRTLS